MMFKLLSFALAAHFVSAFAPISRIARSSNIMAVANEASFAVEYDDFLPQPKPSLSAVDVVSVCMDTLLQRKEAGLEVCFHFSNDRCRAAIGGSLDEFAEYANNPVFSYLIDCSSWTVDSVGSIIPGTPHRGSMQTVLMSAVSGEDARCFLWTLQQERRPPLAGCWTIHESDAFFPASRSSICRLVLQGEELG